MNRIEVFFRRVKHRVWSLRGYAASGALFLTCFVLAKLISDLPRLRQKVALDGWGGVEGVLTGLAIIAAIFTTAALVGALIGLACGWLIQRPEARQERASHRTASKRLE